MHHEKEKIYLHAYGTFLVWTVLKGERKKFLLDDNNNRLVIPSKTPHAVLTGTRKSSSEHHSKMSVIASSQDGNDIVWEAGTDKLIQNLPRG